MLLCHGAASHRTQALGLLDRALATASTLGMAAVAEGIHALRTADAGGTVSGQPTGAEAAGGVSGNVFRREGEYWTVRYGGSVVRLKDAKGLRYLARLLAVPRREFHAVDLAAADHPAEPPVPPTAQAGAAGLRVRADLGDAGELLDAHAKAAYKARLDELAAELEDTERGGDPGRAAAAAAERDFWWTSWRGRSGWAAATAAPPRTPSAPGST